MSTKVRKAESVLVSDMVNMLRLKPKNDRHLVAHPTKPVQNYPYSYRDNAMKCTYYFDTEEKYNKFLLKIQQQNANK